MGRMNQIRIESETQQNLSAPSRSGVFIFWAFIAALTILSIKALNPPPPLAANAAEDQFSAERAFAHVREMARMPHPMGSAANANVRNYLIGQLSQLGLAPQVFSSIGIDPTARLIIAGKTNGILGRFSGSASGPAILLMAHYDSVYSAPGAGDDASGVASVLEIVRALKHGQPLQHDIIVLFTDGEEAGLLGAEAFAHSHPWMKDVGLILNFEARGNRGPSLLFETGPNNRPFIEAVAGKTSHPIGSSLFYELYKLLPNDTDFTVFRPAGVPGLNFAFGEGLSAYHSPLDTPEHLSLASIQHHGSYGVALSRYFGQLDLAALRNTHGDNVFFNWFGGMMMTYSQRWVLPGQVFITLLLVMALILNGRQPEFTWKKFLLSIAACLGLLVLIIGSAAAAWCIIIKILGDRRIISDSAANLFLLSGLMLLCASIGTLVLVAFRKRLRNQELSLAALLLWFFLSWVTAILIPSGSYLFFWPLLLGLLGNISVITKKGVVKPWLQNAPAIGAVVLLFAPVIFLLYIFLTLQFVCVAASALLLGLFLLLSIPAMESSITAARAWALGLLAIPAAVCLITGITLSGYSTANPRPDSIIYSLNADDSTALWISYDEKADDWTQQFLGPNKQKLQPVQNYLAGLPRSFLSAKAPAVQLLPPTIENVEHKQVGSQHTLKLRLRSQRGADALYLRFPNEVQPVSAKLAGREVPVHKGSRFGLTALAMGEEGVELELVVTTPSQLSFWVMDRSYGLPTDTKPRPPDSIEMDGSNMTYVCRKYTL